MLKKIKIPPYILGPIFCVFLIVMTYFGHGESVWRGFLIGSILFTTNTLINIEFELKEANMLSMLNMRRKDKDEQKD